MLSHKPESDIYIRGVYITTSAKRSITKTYDARGLNYKHEKRTTTHGNDKIKDMKFERSKVSYMSKSQAR